MTVLFNQIPGNIRVPFTYFEVNAGQAPYQTNAQLLLIGQMTSKGTATPNEPIVVFGGEDGLFGPGSMLASMYKMARLVAPFQEIWALPLQDEAGSAAASGTILINNWPWTNDELVVYVGDIRVMVPITTLDTPATVATNLASAINSLTASQGEIVTGCSGMQVTATVTAGAPSVGTAAIPAAATGTSGVITLTIGIDTFSAAVAATDTATTIATNLAAAINALAEGVTASAAGSNVTLTTTFGSGAAIPFTLTAPNGSVTTGSLAAGTAEAVVLTANNAGYLGNSIRIETGLTFGDSPWADHNLTIQPIVGGVGQPLLTTGLTNLGSQPFDYIVNPYNDVYTLSEVASFLQQRWGPSEQLYGLQFSCFDGTAAQALAQTSTLNSPYTYLLARYLGPAPTYLWAAALGAQAAQHLQDAPELSRPMQTLPLTGLHAPKLKSNQWSITQRQSFYFGGVSGYSVAKDGTVMLDRVVSTYTVNSYGQPDMTWLDVNTLAQNMYALRFLNQLITSTYPRSALADSNPGNLQGVVTPKDIFNLMVHGYNNLCILGVMQNADMFQQMLVVERNGQDPNRVDAYLPFNVMNQLRIFAANATTYLQYPT